ILKPDNADPFLKKTVSWSGKEKVYKMPKAAKEVFQGSIYVLVNGKTYSAGSTLARYLKEYGNATVIGTETGTRYEGFAAGSRQDIHLPNTQISVGIPRYHITFPTSEKQQTANRGLLPDYTIEPTIETFTKGIDLHVAEAIELIREE
ncbi:MAG: S41 family peptidase, partial [Bacteroidota bacterium]